MYLGKTPDTDQMADVRVQNCTAFDRRRFRQASSLGRRAVFCNSPMPLRPSRRVFKELLKL